ncbi:hypothetical protein M0804_004046 [Polistes exclamans]|nr:hypothetical protein M0804_004046 [Polistes exclamans]
MLDSNFYGGHYCREVYKRARKINSFRSEKGVPRGYKEDNGKTTRRVPVEEVWSRPFPGKGTFLPCEMAQRMSSNEGESATTAGGGGNDGDDDYDDDDDDDDDVNDDDYDE